MSNNAKQALAERLRSAREYVGLSQEEVSVYLGVPRPAVSQMENGNRRVDAIELARLAKLYQRPVSYFTSETDDAAPQLELLSRAASELSSQDRDEVLRFAEFLKSRTQAGEKK